MYISIHNVISCSRCFMIVLTVLYVTFFCFAKSLLQIHFVTTQILIIDISFISLLPSRNLSVEVDLFNYLVCSSVNPAVLHHNGKDDLSILFNLRCNSYQIVTTLGRYSYISFSRASTQCIYN